MLQRRVTLDTPHSETQGTQGGLNLPAVPSPEGAL